MLRKIIAAMSAFFGIVLFTSCTALLNATIPRAGYSIHKDIAYGSDPRQKLDIYIPDHLTKPAPVVLFFYGGSWQFGAKNEYLFVGQALASKGYVTVIADYRLYPQVYFPTFMEDSAQALVWVHKHIADYHGDVGNLFVAGHSAGAYNAVMLGADPRYLDAAVGKESWIRGIIGISGPYDFLPFTDPKIIALFSKAPDEETQPIHFMTHTMPPLMLVTGDADTLVSESNSLHVKTRLDALGSPVELHVYHGLGHIGTVLSLARGFRYKASTLKDIAAFIDAHTVPPAMEKAQ
jgi:acetyl esterase/lipase